MPGPRRWFQVFSTLFQNAYWGFILKGTIYQGPLKSICTPGLNCYSCPAATTACPLGEVQNFMAGFIAKLRMGVFHPGLYVLGFMGFVGSLVGRMSCGWLCPFGFLQDLLHKIPCPKLSIPRFLLVLKYLVLVLTVLILPAFYLDPFGYGQTWFCKMICPAGTLEAGLSLVLMNDTLRSRIGGLYFWKIGLLLFFLVWMILARRPFCRTVCPLGAFYALFNRVSIVRLAHNREKCVMCKQCLRECPMGIGIYEGANQGNCIRCLQCMQKSCRYGAISLEIAGTSRVQEVATKNGA